MLKYTLFFGYVAPLFVTVWGAKTSHAFSKNECYALIAAFIFVVSSIVVYWQRKPRKKQIIVNGTVTKVRYLTDVKETGNDDVNCELSISFPFRNEEYTIQYQLVNFVRYKESTVVQVDVDTDHPKKSTLYDGLPHRDYSIIALVSLSVFVLWGMVYLMAIG